MGEAKRKKQTRAAWPDANHYYGTIDLRFLPAAASINSARIRELTGDNSIPDATHVILQAFKAKVGDRICHVGFCLGDGEAFSAVGIAIIERLSMAAPGAPIHVVPVVHEDIAWDIVLRHMRSFTGEILLFTFPNSDVYDAGKTEIFYSKHIRLFDSYGAPLDRLTETQRRKIREAKASALNRPPPPRFYPAHGVAQEDSPWIFRVGTPAGKVVRTAVWNGRRNYAHEFPKDFIRCVGGSRIAIVQVDSPVGVNRRSSLDLTHKLSKDFDGVIHWARDTETFESILKSFIRLDLDSVSPPHLPEGWDPEIIIFTANGDSSD